MPFCLPKDISKPLKTVLQSEGNLKKLFNAKDSAEREKILTDIVGKDKAKNATEEFEKNFMQKSAKLSDQEVKSILEMANETEKAKLNSKSRVEAGMKQIAFNRELLKRQRVAGLKNESIFSKDPLATSLNLLEKSGELLKTVQTTLDDSAILNQGGKVKFTNPIVWMRNSAQSFINGLKVVMEKQSISDVEDMTMAEIITRDSYPLMKIAKLEIGNIEEDLPTSVLEKIPAWMGVGRLFKAADVSFRSFLWKTRADVFDWNLKVQKFLGSDITDKAVLEDVGKLVNSMTGRGDLGSMNNASKWISNFIFSVRKLKGSADFLTAHVFDKDMSWKAKAVSASHLATYVVCTAAVLNMAKALDPKSVLTKKGWYLSSDAYKILGGDTSYDITSGDASILILAARIAEGATQSSKGKTYKLDTGKYGVQSSEELLMKFFMNKQSPGPNLAFELKTGRDFLGKPIPKKNVLSQVDPIFDQQFITSVLGSITPLIVQNISESKQVKDSNTLLTAISEFVGINTNTYKR